jgi:hypothetical protein
MDRRKSELVALEQMQRYVCAELCRLGEGVIAEWLGMGADSIRYRILESTPPALKNKGRMELGQQV